MVDWSSASASAIRPNVGSCAYSANLLLWPNVKIILRLNLRLRTFYIWLWPKVIQWQYLYILYKLQPCYSAHSGSQANSAGPALQRHVLRCSRKKQSTEESYQLHPLKRLVGRWRQCWQWCRPSGITTGFLIAKRSCSRCDSVRVTAWDDHDSLSFDHVVNSDNTMMPAYESRVEFYLTQPRVPRQMYTVTGTTASSHY